MSERYAVFGHPVAHSLSPRIHALFAKQTGHDIRYEAIDAPPEGFADALAAFAAHGGRAGRARDARSGRAPGRCRRCCRRAIPRPRA